MTMNLRVPLSITACGTAAQFGALRSEVCCRMNPADGEGHETVTAGYCGSSVMVKSGAPGVCTAKSDQKPPWNEKLPPVRACGVASCCPMVALTEKFPPLLVPPPPSSVNQSSE